MAGAQVVVLSETPPRPPDPLALARALLTPQLPDVDELARRVGAKQAVPLSPELQVQAWRQGAALASLPELVRRAAAHGPPQTRVGLAAEALISLDAPERHAPLLARLLAEAPPAPGQRPPGPGGPAVASRVAARRALAALRAGVLYGPAVAAHAAAVLAAREAPPGDDELVLAALLLVPSARATPPDVDADGLRLLVRGLRHQETERAVALLSALSGLPREALGRLRWWHLRCVSRPELLGDLLQRGIEPTSHEALRASAPARRWLALATDLAAAAGGGAEPDFAGLAPDEDAVVRLSARRRADDPLSVLGALALVRQALRHGHDAEAVAARAIALGRRCAPLMRVLDAWRTVDLAAPPPELAEVARVTGLAPEVVARYLRFRELTGEGATFSRALREALQAPPERVEAAGKRARRRLERALPELGREALKQLVEDAALRALGDVVGRRAAARPLSREDLGRLQGLFVDLRTRLPLVGALVREAVGRQALASRPPNAAWCERARAAGVDVEAWLGGLDVEVEVAGERLRVQTEADPWAVLDMGTWFGTCLSLEGGFNCASTLVNALDVNKHLVVARRADGKVFGRKLIGATARGELAGYHTYAHEHGLALREALSEALRGFAARCGLRPSDRATPEVLHDGFWYDDGNEGWQARTAAGPHAGEVARALRAGRAPTAAGRTFGDDLAWRLAVYGVPACRPAVARLAGLGPEAAVRIAVDALVRRRPDAGALRLLARASREAARRGGRLPPVPIEAGECSVDWLTALLEALPDAPEGGVVTRWADALATAGRREGTLAAFAGSRAVPGVARGLLVAALEARGCWPEPTVRGGRRDAGPRPADRLRACLGEAEGPSRSWAVRAAACAARMDAGEVATVVAGSETLGEAKVVDLAIAEDAAGRPWGPLTRAALGALGEATRRRALAEVKRWLGDGGGC